jgi:PAS domain S-box-containing protein
MPIQQPDVKSPPAWARYAVSIGCVVLGWLAREALTPAIGPTALPFIFFFPAVAMAAWYGRFGPGALTTVLSGGTATWFFIQPLHSLAIDNWGDALALAAFLVSSLFIVAAIQAMHRARERAMVELRARDRAEAELVALRENFGAAIGRIGEVAPTAAAASPEALVPGGDWWEGAVRRIGLLFLTAAALLVVSTILVYRVGLIRIHAQQQMATQLLVSQQLEEFLSSLKDAETGQRGYLLTGDDPYLEPYTSMRQAVGTRLDSLQNLALSGELPNPAVERLATLTKEKLAEMERTIQTRRDKGLEAALAIVRDNQGKHVMDELRGDVARMRQDEQKKFAKTSERANWSGDFRTGTFVAMGLLNLAFLGWAFRRIASEVRRREIAGRETREQKELLATTVASIGDAVMITSADGRLILLNGEAERLTGWTTREATGRPLNEVFRILNEQTRQPVENPVEKVLRQGAVVGLANHTVLLRRDQTEVPIDDSAAPIRVAGGPLFGVVMVFRDVTQQRKAQATLRQSERSLAGELKAAQLLQEVSTKLIQTDRVDELYDQILDAAIALVDSDMGSIQMFDHERHELRLLAWKGFHPESALYWKTITTDIVTTCGAALKVGQRLIVPDVTTCEFLKGTDSLRHYNLCGIVSVQSTPLVSRDGRLVGMISTHWRQRHEPGQRELRFLDVLAREAADLVERKRAEQELERLVADRTAKLQELVGELEHFSYSITHDMRAPLRAMRAFAELLKESAEHRLPEEDRNFVERIITGAERMDALIADALNYSKAVRSDLPVGPVDVERLVSGMLATYPEFQATQAEITIAGKLPLVIGNEAGLTQCFSNLIANAVKFVQPGAKAKVRIWCEVPVDGHHVQLHHPPNHAPVGHLPGRVRLWVEDNGIGISKEMLPRVFHMFSHGASPQAGTGIGLALVRKVVERMGGKVGVESEAGIGSRFWVELKSSAVKKSGDITVAAAETLEAAARKA